MDKISSIIYYGKIEGVKLIFWDRLGEDYYEFKEYFTRSQRKSLSGYQAGLCLGLLTLGRTP